jgi:hypothetical protein
LCINTGNTGKEQSFEAAFVNLMDTYLTVGYVPPHCLANKPENWV